MPNKQISAAAAAELIRDGDTVTTSGFVGIGVPEELLVALETRFVETARPRDLTLFFAAGQGDGKDRGLNRLGHEGLLARVIGGHWGLIPKVAALATAGKIAAYNLPQGVISHLYRDIAAGRPGTLSRVGLGTFVDPRLEGGKINDVTHDEIVSVLEVGGAEHLFYRALPVHVALLRGTSADPAGNISMEREALVIDNLAQAMAAKNSGGVVIVQVERMVARHGLNPRDVVIPGALVDAVVVAAPENHHQTFATPYSHAFSGQFRVEADTVPEMPLTPRKVIARRAAFELPINGVVNLGIGMPEGVAAVAGEEKLLPHLTLTAEPGVIGGQPASGLDFGAAVNTDAIVPQSAQFDFYDGGGLDIAVLGMAQVDARGNVNVSRFGPKLAGAGGFINISQNARAVVFAGTFTSVGLDLAVSEAGVEIRSEGRVTKFVEAVEQVTFSGPLAAAAGKKVLYVTERAVFRLRPEGVELVEIAPGIDLERDVLAHMAFAPEMAPEIAEMDARLFAEGPMGLRVDLLHLDLDDRVALSADKAQLFLNFEKMRVRAPGDVNKVRARVEAVCAPLGHRVDVVANYDGARIDEEVEDAWVAMVQQMEDRFYGTVTRYSGSAFMRMKLGAAFAREVRPHVFETATEARAFLSAARGGSFL
ncbi:acyl CoA:acetate/3-ketoacid CoA transferase [Dinoroseobacter sp. PD6]|uniref:acyl CoA:acetate/3-ketoacid CoA transferase n=1 Tax=Dinoroseobacter sp. PD6 TaxID=3028384 RepID=UPI00237AAF0B|nr:CoA-transferase [Dinoroseobacter sp. PD6]MDD9718285.1 acyl CoA:acetate/3-ketoacid CoA transferase [Dinoroseobacter sp. PD6]